MPWKCVCVTWWGYFTCILVTIKHGDVWSVLCIGRFNLTCMERGPFIHWMDSCVDSRVSLNQVVRACVHPTHKPNTNLLAWNHSVYWFNSADYSVTHHTLYFLLINTGCFSCNLQNWRNISSEYNTLAVFLIIPQTIQSNTTNFIIKK